MKREFIERVGSYAAYLAEQEEETRENRICALALVKVAKLYNAHLVKFLLSKITTEIAEDLLAEEKRAEAREKAAKSGGIL